MAIIKALSKSTFVHHDAPIANQELARLSACMTAMLEELDALDAQGLLGDGYAATGQATPSTRDGSYGVTVTLSRR